VLAEVLAALAPGASIAELCEKGDAAIEAACAKTYTKKKDMAKGVAFPTCISVNELIAHYSPLKSESRVLAAGDAVKVDLGVHLDGFAALVAQTVVLRAADAPALTGPQADVIAAAHAAGDVVLRLLKPGARGAAVTDAVERTAAAFGVSVVSSVQCSLLQQYSLDSGKSVPLKRDAGVKYEDVTFAANEVWCVEVALSTGEGTPRETEARTTVFRRVVEVSRRARARARACGRR
jgi:curved DNA binding protein